MKNGRSITLVEPDQEKLFIIKYFYISNSEWKWICKVGVAAGWFPNEESGTNSGALAGTEAGV